MPSSPLGVYKPLPILLPILDSHTHKNYKEALMHQMRLQTGQNLRNKLYYSNAIEESSLVHTGNEDLDGQQVQHASKLSNKDILIKYLIFVHPQLLLVLLHLISTISSLFVVLCPQTLLLHC